MISLLFTLSAFALEPEVTERETTEEESSEEGTEVEESTEGETTESTEEPIEATEVETIEVETTENTVTEEPTEVVPESEKSSNNKQSRSGLSLGVGSLGMSFSYIYAVNKDCAVSLQTYWLQAPESTKDTDVGSYQDLTTLQGTSLLVHYHPFQERAKWARVSFGATYNMSTIDISKSGEAVPVGVEGTETDLTDNALEASVAFNNILPYFSLGTGISNKKGFGFFFDLGMMYQGPSTVTFSENYAVSVDDMLHETSVLEEFYNGQAQVYPVLQLGATYMF